MADPSTLLDELTKHGEHSTSLHQLAHCLSFAFGGPPGLANVLRQEFDANNPGSANRIKIALAVLGLYQSYGGDDPDATESEEVLEALARQVGGDGV